MGGGGSWGACVYVGVGGAVWLASHHQLDSGGPSLLSLTIWGTGHWVGTVRDIFDLVDLFSDHLENHHNSREKTKGQTQKTGR